MRHRQAGIRTRVAQAIAAIALLAVACTPSPSATPVGPGPTIAGTVFDVVTSMPDGQYRLPISLLDRTGLITEVTALPVAVDFAVGVENFEDDHALVYTWIGGACDTRTLLTFEQTEAGFRLVTRTTVSGEACDAIGLTRQILVRVSEPVAAATVSVERAPG